MSDDLVAALAIDYGEPTEPGWYLVKIGGISQPRKFIAMGDGRLYCHDVALANGATVRFGPRIPEDWGACWDLGRAQELRRQAEKTCERRTAELEGLRPAEGFVELARQIRRLRQTQCPTMGWQSNSDPAGQIAAVERELAELKLEQPGTEAFAAEAADLLTTVINLLVSADLDARTDLEVGLRWLFGGETLLLRVGRDEYDLALLVAGGTARKTTCTPRNSMASALRELRGGV